MLCSRVRHGGLAAIASVVIGASSIVATAQIGEPGATCEAPIEGSTGTDAFTVTISSTVPTIDSPATVDGSRWVRIPTRLGHLYQITLRSNIAGGGYFFLQQGCDRGGGQYLRTGSVFIRAQGTSLFLRLITFFASERVTGDVTDHGAVTDDYPNIDAEAPLQSTGGWIPGQLEYVQDVDVLAFAAKAGDLLRVRVENLDSSAGVALIVFADNVRIGGGAIYSYSSSGIDVLVAVPAGFTGSRIVARLNASDSEIAPYRIRVDRSGVANSSGGDSCATAMPLTPSGTGEVRVVAPQESRWFAVNATQGHVYAVTTQTRSETNWGSAYVRIASECSSDRVYRRYSTYYRQDTAGALLIEVANLGQSNEVYELSVRDDGYADDPEGETVATAGTLPSNSTIISGNIDYRTDVDAFRLAAPPRSLVKIDFRPLSQQTGWEFSASSLRPTSAQEAVLFLYQSYGWPSTATGFAWDSDYFVVPARTDRDWYLRVSNVLFGGYQIRASIVQSNVGIEAASSCDAPLRMDVGVPLRMSTASPDESVVSRIELSKGRRYRFAVNGSTGLSPYWGVGLLRPGCGEGVSSPDDPGYQYASLREWEPDETGRYNLRLNTGSSRDSVTVVVRVDDLGEATDTGGNDAAHATDLASGRQPVFGRIDYNGDADVFKVRLAPYVKHRIQLRGANRNINAIIIPPTNTSDGLSLEPVYDTDYAQAQYLLSFAGTEPRDVYLKLVNWNQESPRPYVLRVVTDGCPGDWDGSGTLTTTDLFSFLRDWLASRADFNASGTTTHLDLFDFLGDWFKGCRTTP